MLTNLKQRSAVLLTMAVLCATVALVPHTAGAAASVNPTAGTLVPNDPHIAAANPELMKACPGSSAAAAGFTDTTSTDVDCIKMFGITQGKDATTYDPSGTVSRQDMARFIHRMFVPAGVAAAGTTALPTFTDTAHVAADGLAAINALASHGITTGMTATTFSPDTNVTRAQMAAFLSRFASIAKDHAGNAIASTTGDGTYNYTDIAGVTFEEHESIIRLYNLGITDACVVAATGAGCDTTYRPADDITRAEMASMVTGVLNHTNARPAGVSIQSYTVNTTVGNVDVLISSRNADFSAEANVLVDEFYALHDDTPGVAAVAPFHSILGTCNTPGTTKTLGGTKCVVDATDSSTDVRGNISGTRQVTAAYKTASWWVHTGASGSQYVDGTTADTFKYSISFGAASTLVDATSVECVQAGVNALMTDKSGLDGITDQKSINTWAGQTRNVVCTLKAAATPTATIKSGYSMKATTVTVDNLGNQTHSSAYYPQVGATFTVPMTCPADTTAGADVSWFSVIEHTLTINAAIGNGRPTNAADPMNVGGANASLVWGAGIDGTQEKVSVHCDDAPRAYAGSATGALNTAETMSVSSNNVASSTAGTLVSITTTAYDQYGDGVAGATSQFTRVSMNTAGASTTTASVATLSSAANGTATLSAVVCATGEVSSAWSVTDPGGSESKMDGISATAPGTAATTGEGTTIYCTTNATDGAIADLAGVSEVFTVTLDTSGNNTDLGGTFVLAFGGVNTGNINHDGNAGHINGVLDATSTIDTDAINCTSFAETPDGGTHVSTCTFNVNYGPATAVTCPSVANLTGGGTETCVIAYSQATGVFGYEKDFLDDNTATGTILTKLTNHSIVSGVMTPVPTYVLYPYDSTDAFNIGAAAVATAVTGASMAEFVAAMAAETGTTIGITGSLRTGATTTKVSSFTLG